MTKGLISRHYNAHPHELFLFAPHVSPTTATRTNLRAPGLAIYHIPMREDRDRCYRLLWEAMGEPANEGLLQLLHGYLMRSEADGNRVVSSEGEGHHTPLGLGLDEGEGLGERAHSPEATGANAGAGGSVESRARRKAGPDNLGVDRSTHARSCGAELGSGSEQHMATGLSADPV